MAGVKYKNPPIREAIFDVRFKFENQLEMSIFESFFKETQESYPKREILNTHTFSFEVKSGEGPKMGSSGGPKGLRLRSRDGTKFVQARIDGFTFSQLEPYGDWDSFFAEAKHLLDVYLEKTHPMYAERIALRYVNAIKIPEKNFELEDYFLTAPSIAKDIPQSLLNFFLRVMIKDNKSDSVAIVNQTIEDTKSIDTTTIIFDIDVFQANLRVDPNGAEAKEIIEALKDFRTRIFEGSITKKTKDIFG